jgi:Tol biopolymer transport system component
MVPAPESGGRDAAARAAGLACALLGAVALASACADPRENAPSPLATVESGAPALPAAAAGVSPEAPLARVSPRLSPRNLTRTGERNEAAPRFSSDGRYLGFERREGSAQALFVADLSEEDSPLQRISSLDAATPASLEDRLLGTATRDDSFNAQLSFVPPRGGVIFTGNAGTGRYRLYRASLGSDGSPPEAITAHASEAGHPAVSPDGRWLAYVSARDGVGKLFLRDLSSGKERRLTGGTDVDLHPTWSPDSRSIAFTSGANDNHDVFLIRDVADPGSEPVAITRWNFDDLRPIFSPDGGSLAFYSSFDPAGEDKAWSIVVVPADGSGPAVGRALAERAAAANVVKDSAVGPAWLPGGGGLVYARNLREEWNPIYVVDVSSGAERRIETGTRMNHDLTCSRQGLLAFRAQVGSWDDIFVASLVARP